MAIAEDLRTAFTGAGPDGVVPGRLNAQVGARLRHTVLARGGEADPADLLRDFLGRPTNGPTGVLRVAAAAPITAPRLAFAVLVAPA